MPRTKFSIQSAPIALRMVYEVASALREPFPQVPIIGLGGISTANDALEFLMAGASAVQVGTINFTNSHAAAEIIAGTEEFMAREGLQSVAEIRMLS